MKEIKETDTTTTKKSNKNKIILISLIAATILIIAALIFFIGINSNPYIKTVKNSVLPETSETVEKKLKNNKQFKVKNWKYVLDDEGNSLVLCNLTAKNPEKALFPAEVFEDKDKNYGSIADNWLNYSVGSQFMLMRMMTESGDEDTIDQVFEIARKLGYGKEVTQDLFFKDIRGKIDEKAAASEKDYPLSECFYKVTGFDLTIGFLFGNEKDFNLISNNKLTLRIANKTEKLNLIWESTDVTNGLAIAMIYNDEPFFHQPMEYIKNLINTCYEFVY